MNDFLKIFCDLPGSSDTHALPVHVLILHKIETGYRGRLP